MKPDPFHALRDLAIPGGEPRRFYSLPALEEAGLGPVSRLPVSLRIVLESVLRHFDNEGVTEEPIRRIAAWAPQAARLEEIPFFVARVLLQDFTGVPLLCDLAAMRSAAHRLGADPGAIEPQVPVHLVVDHSVQVDVFNSAGALQANMEWEARRNAERYRFIKWGKQVFETFKVVPPGKGICHQINLEHLSRGVWLKDGVLYPDTLVGTDSHTTMINGLGVVGWGVGGIEAEAAMLGQPVYLLMPDVVGVHLHGRLAAGVTSTDLVLAMTERLRHGGVVGAFVEFFGEGAASLTVPDRATLGNMAPEYGATLGYFPVDEQTLRYLRATGRSAADVAVCEAYYRAQGLFGMPRPGDLDYSRVIEVDLGSITPSVAGPKRPQDRIDLADLKRRFTSLLIKPVSEGGYGIPEEGLARRHSLLQLPAPDPALDRSVALGHGDVLIAALTSCTNTSNPGVMLAAGLLAKKAVERGLSVRPHIKTSLAPGSRVVTDYLARAGLLPYLEQLGFGGVGYGCTTCIGNPGPLEPRLEETLTRQGIVGAAVLSGNRNFEARIHVSLKANFLMSPPLVVAFALAGRVDIDLTQEPLGHGRDGRPVYLRELWPSPREIQDLMGFAADPEAYRTLYADLEQGDSLWQSLPVEGGQRYGWPNSTYIAEPPFFGGFTREPGPTSGVRGARALALFGDSVTTDHISPAGAIQPSSPAGVYLQGHGVAPADFNSYGSRRGNHEVMVRGTFANVRIKNLMLPPLPDGGQAEGGLTLLQPGGQVMPIFDAAMIYQELNTPTIIFAGEEYGTGSSRDWAAKGTRLLGVKAVIARSFERIHRSNLVGMGVLPLQFQDGDSLGTLGIRGDEVFDLLGLEKGLEPRQEVTLEVTRKDGSTQRVSLRLRIDSPIEASYYLHGGILPYVLRSLVAGRMER